ncbi:MAG: hypothetical protein VX589_00295 [Myxococcota bacterium]|nr:hypothetical protein [Myxococcota bacterium]
MTYICLHNQAMRRYGLIIGLTALCSGCLEVKWSALSSPANHPLLNVHDWRIKRTARAHRASTARNPSQFFGVVRRNVKQVDHRRYRSRGEEFALLRAVFRGTSIEHQLRQIRTIDQLKALGKPIRQPSRIGDILFFDRSSRGARVAVVTGRTGLGAFKAIAVHLGKAQTIYVHPGHRTKRRKKGRIVNTFIRPVSPGDPSSQRYLAGDALQEVRRLGQFR